MPRVNWGDLFFDLHYVAATYNVSNLIVQDPSFTGLLYATGTFLPVMAMWVHNTIFSGRFTVQPKGGADDLYHRLVQIAVLVVLATAVLHIRPVNILKRSSQHISMFVFALCLCLDKLLLIVNQLEVYWYGIGQRHAIQAVARRELILAILVLFFYATAALMAALEFFPRQYDDDKNNKDSNYDSSSSPSSYNNKEADDPSVDTNGGKDDPYHNLRFLAAPADEKTMTSGEEHDDDPTTNLPIYLCLAGFVFNFAYLAVYVVFMAPKDGRHKEFMVPVNVDFVIHRFGEWTMLMLGESIFSILIVNVSNETREYYGTFYGSILTVILLQYLHFKSEPHHAEGHAMRRNKDAGLGWNALVHVYSFALVCLGAAYTFFLMDFDDSTASSSSSSYRFLAGGGDDDSLDGEARMQRAAHIFCGSLAVIFACLDGMTIFHVGLNKALG